jgi:hypothetical protein
MTSLRQRMTEDMQVRNLALNTQMSYVQQVSLFARHFNKSPEQLGPDDIRAYQIYLFSAYLVVSAEPHRLWFSLFDLAWQGQRLPLSACKARVYGRY